MNKNIKMCATKITLQPRCCGIRPWPALSSRRRSPIHFMPPSL